MSSRKDKIKNIAILFLSILLILTFFSNTIMNYSLVEVSTQQIYGDTLTTKVRGSGTVEASETYTVSISESRKIATVNVKTGDEVEAGDVLFTLEDQDSEELAAAKKSLSEAETAYETAVLEAGLTVDERLAIESGKSSSLSEKQNEQASLQAALDTATANVAAAQKTVDDLTAQIEALSDATVDTTAETKALADATAAYTAAKNTVDNLTAQLSAYDGKDTLTTEEQTQKSELEAQLIEAQINANNCSAAVTNAQNALDAKSNSTEISSQKAALETQLTTAKAALTTATEAQTAAQTALEDGASKNKNETSIAAQYEALVELQEEVAELEENAVGAEVTSPIAGTVTEIDYTAGQTVEAEAAMMLIQPENKAFTLQFTVTENQAKRIKVGDEADVLNNWSGDDISAKVITIRKDQNDKSSRIVICELSGDDVSVGDNYTLSIGEQSSSYDMVVPTSAIREDSNGKFILVIESKSTPLGNRYYARRADIEVITSDDTRTAINATIDSYSYVITTTTKPVEENQQVRLATE